MVRKIGINSTSETLGFLSDLEVFESIDEWNGKDEEEQEEQEEHDEEEQQKLEQQFFLELNEDIVDKEALLDLEIVPFFEQ